MKVSFDDCFQTFPTIKSPNNLEDVWDRSLTELRKIPVDPKTRMILSRSLGRESLNEVSLAGFGGYRIRGLFAIPRRRGKVPAILTFHDYGEPLRPERDLVHEGFAHLALQLRGHEGEFFNNTLPPVGESGGPLRGAGLDVLEKSLPFLCFMDAIRCIDYLRLHRSIDSNRIGLLGRGFGAAMAVFAAAHMPANVAALSLERPSFLWLSRWIEDATGPLADDTRALLRKTGRNQARVRRHLALLDGLLWSESLSAPVQASIALEDEVRPARPAFGFFNHIVTEKSMEIYPDDIDQIDLKEERRKSMRFLSEQLSGPS